MYNNQFGYNPYYPQFNNNFNQPIQNPAVNTQSSAVSSAVNRPSLNGKLVDSIDVVKSLEIPLDGSTSFFPLVNETAIVTKKLNQDGTSKITIYKPTEEKDTPKIEYVTKEDLKKTIDSIDLSEIEDLKDEIKELKAEIKKIKKGD